MDRRGFMQFAVAMAGSAVVPSIAAAQPDEGSVAVFTVPTLPEADRPHSFDDVVERARDLASSAFKAREPVLAPPFADLSASEYAAIQPNPAARIDLGGAPAMGLEPLPPGHIFEYPIRLDLVRNGRTRAIEFASHYFLRNGEPIEEVSGDDASRIGFSGFRLMRPLTRPEIAEEVASFHGASHFRARHRGGAFGSSARGLALSTASPEGEEVPRFTQFWIHAAEEDKAATRIHALLDGPSVAGAFAFELRPGDATTLDVRCRLFPRVEIGSVGIAPLSSMHFFGPDNRGAVDDIRNAVHDSEGLQIITGRGERLWRPLGNPPALRLSGFVDQDPRLFGLAQRNRSFDWFGDPAAAFQNRPSVWVEPRSPWGPGQVVLVELPLPNEVNDNIIAFWRPEAPLEAGGDYAFDYTVGWSALVPDPEPLARVVATRSGSDGEEARRFAVDFDRSALPAGPLDLRVNSSQGLLSDIALIDTPDPSRVRASFRFAPGGAEQSEFRLSLYDAAGNRASETWLYRWTRT